MNGRLAPKRSKIPANVFRPPAGGFKLIGRYAPTRILWHRSPEGENQIRGEKNSGCQLAPAGDRPLT
eukprot:583677-Heterocapsa_arctica.AAC.1